MVGWQKWGLRGHVGEPGMKERWDDINRNCGSNMGEPGMKERWDDMNWD